MNPVSTAPKKTTSQTKVKFNIGVISPITEQNDSALMCEVLDAMCSLKFKVSVLAEGDASGQAACFNCSEKYPKQFSMIESMGDNRGAILAKSDVVIFPTAPSKKELAEVIKSGVVPVMPDGCGLPNFDSKTEEGCAFTFESGNVWSMVAALVRASENRKFSWDWKTVKQNLAEYSI